MPRLDPHLSWYAARASGLVAWGLVTASILWGLTLSTRLVRKKGVPAWLLGVHRYLGTLSIVFVTVHVVALVADNYVYFGWGELFVPMASPWRPLAVAWGIVATYLLVAIQVTSWAMRKMPRRVWHAVHLSSFALFAAATAHGFTTGADASKVVVRWVAATGGCLVVVLVFLRTTRRDRRAKRPDRRVSVRSTQPVAIDV